MSRASAFEESRLDLARLTVQGLHELRRGLEQAAVASANAIHVARVGVWFLSPDGLTLMCACQCGPDGPREPHDAVISLERTPLYKAALLCRRVVLIDDVLAASETNELANSYLVPNGITSMLDAPVYRFGEVVGVVCHEHVGERRTWTPRERDFAASVADIVAVLIEQATRMDGEMQLNAQLEHAAKLERQASLARLAGGVAHDFNNVLTAMVLELELLRPEVAPRLTNSIDELLGFIATGKGIVSQLLTYSKAGTNAPRPLVLSRLLNERRRLLEASVGLRHHIEFEIAAGDPIAVHADPAQIDQLLLNLVTNARDAMPNGGTVLITLSSDGDWAELAVIDQGDGIEESVRDRIFEPFFSTKGGSRGLGLSTVHSIVEQNHGTVRVESTVGHGTRFVVRLPRVDP